VADVSELVDAIRSDDHAEVERIVTAEPELAAIPAEDGLSAVVLARYWGRRLVLDKLLVARGDNLDVFEAAMVGRRDLVRAHLARDPELARAWSPDGFTALHYPAFFGGIETATALVDAGADIDAVSRNDQAVRPLHSASAGRHLDVCRLLVERGADVRATQQQGYTPLHQAAQHGDEVLVDLLLAAGADPSARLDDGRTAADLARAAGREGLAVRLVSETGTS
jgi:ankyrin repeat protein